MISRCRFPGSSIRSTRWLIALALLLGAASSGAAQPRPPKLPPRVTTVNPVTTQRSIRQNADRCLPLSLSGPPPFWFGANIRVGGAALAWMAEPNTEYVLERSTHLDLNAFTTLASTCGDGAPLIPGEIPWEDGTNRPILRLDDDAPGVILGARHRYRLTGIRFDRSASSVSVDYDVPIASFRVAASVSVAGHAVTVTTPVSYCVPPGERCDPSWVEYTFASSSAGFAYSSRQTWVNNAAPLAEPGTFTFTIANVPSGNHQLVVTAIYPPAFRALMGTLPVQVP